MRKALLGLPPALRTATYVACASDFRRYGATALVRADTNRSSAGYATIHPDESSRIWADAQQLEMQPQTPQNNAAPNGTSHSVSSDIQSLETATQNFLNKNFPSGPKKKQALQRATKFMSNLSALRTSDALQIRKKVEEAVDGKEFWSTFCNASRHVEVLVSARPVDDLEHYSRTLPLPTPQRYPKAPEAFFDPKTTSVAINDAAQQRKFGLSLSSQYDAQRDVYDTWKCSLTVEIGDLSREHGVGQGTTKLLAKQAAWQHVVLKMHESGSLDLLFPADEVQAPSSPAEPSVEFTPELAETTSLDEKTRIEQSTAKAEIYEYAATWGLMPNFEYTALQRRLPRSRRTQELPRHMTKCAITLSERAIDVSAIGRDRITAEIAAAIAFKQEVEKQHAAGMHDLSLSASQMGDGILSSETGLEFVEHYCRSAPGMEVELEQETRSDSGTTYSWAQVLINGELAGKPVSMNTKEKAAKFAYLTAAVALAVQKPELLKSYLDAKRKVSGKKVLTPLSTIDLSLSYGIVESMRKGLLEAREAGIPDSKDILEAQIWEDSVYRHRRQRLLQPHEQEALNAKLFHELHAYTRAHSLAELRARKAALPMNGYRKRVLDLVDKHQYSIIVGATGSGKTTQVPQILLERAILEGKAATTNIICTQPRKIAARSVAQRVAVERNESLQQSTGYHVRDDAKLPRTGASMTFCTTGILLEQLKYDADNVLDRVSHILVDEVHERDLPIDFLLTVLKKNIAARSAVGKPVPKVVLMSATIDADLFAQYFALDDAGKVSQPCPILKVPGRIFPVQEAYLDDIFGELLKTYGSEMKNLLDNDKKIKEYLAAEVAFSKEHSSRSHVEPGEIDWKRIRKPVVADENPSLERIEALVPIPLIAATISHLCKTTSEGAILVFVPGMDEILATQKLLLRAGGIFGNDFHDGSKFKICVVHSAVSKEMQNEIFASVPPKCRKIILSTNIAETSVTVPDVKFVVDSGKLREKRYDQVRRISKLQTVWESKSNAKQRAGRAGRVQEGFYYGLFSKERSQSLREVGLPELLRSDLQTTCLSIKAQKFDEPVETFLAAAIEPPPVSAVHAAVTQLKGMEAFTEHEELTALGRVLARLPLHPALGKMIILGIVFRCLDPMLVLGAAAEERSLWAIPLGMKAEATAAHATYGGQQSDQLAILEAFKELRALREEFGDHAVTQRANEKFLHIGAFRSIDSIARQIDEILAECGLTPHTPIFDRQAHQYGHPDLNRNSKNAALINGLLLAGHYPNLAVKRSTEGPLYRTSEEGSVLMHPGSLNNDLKSKAAKNKKSELFIFRTLQKSLDGSALFLVDTSRVDPLVSLLFGGTLRMTEGSRMEKDGWLPCFVKSDHHAHAAKIVLEFRKSIDRMLNNAFKDLANVNAEKEIYLADDPARVLFANHVVAVLRQLNANPNDVFAGQWHK